MPDERSHRGPHPDDAKLFAPSMWSALRAGVAELSWLLTRGYAQPSALKLVGDRYELTQRQRIAVARCACTDDQLRCRRSNEAPPAAMADQPLLIDGYNLLITIEAALGGGVVLIARDGAYRDVASLHGTYRKVEETLPALNLIGQALALRSPSRCIWYLDSPVSNSGRLKGLILFVARERGWPWDVQVVQNPDAVLSAASDLVATADSIILDRCRSWVNLAKEVVASAVPGPNRVDLSETALKELPSPP